MPSDRSPAHASAPARSGAPVRVDAAAEVGGDTGGPLPSRWRRACFETPLGPMVGIAGDAGLTRLEFADRRAIDRELEDVRRTGGTEHRPHPVLEQAERELGEYFAGARTAFTLPLDLRGTAFERSVWRRLLAIPHGATASYAEIARDLGKPGASRAVGRANGANRIAVVIPCHRVIRSDGSLRGYGGGLDRKRWLLEHEAPIRRFLADPTMGVS